MSEQDQYTPLQQIKKSQENTVVVIGVSIAFVLLLYFFSFAAMVDHGSALAWFQAVTTVLMAVMLVYIKRIAFFITRLRLGHRSPYRETLAHLTLAELDEVKLDS